MRPHLKDEFVNLFRGRDPMEELCGAVIKREQLDGRHVVHQSTYLWMKTALAQNILRTLGDGCESAHGTEGRLPMLDHHLFHWVKEQPMSSLFQLTDCDARKKAGSESATLFTEKGLLRNAMRDRLPSQFVNRPKHPFDAPPLAKCFLRNRRIRDRMEAAIDCHPYFDPDKVRNTMHKITGSDVRTMTAIDPLWWMVLSSAGPDVC